MAFAHSSNRPQLQTDRSVPIRSPHVRQRNTTAIAVRLRIVAHLCLVIAIATLGSGDAWGQNYGFSKDVSPAQRSLGSSAQPNLANPTLGQRTKQSVSVRRPSLENYQPTQLSIDAQRERMFNELAEEFDTFDRLGNLVRRVSQLVKPSVIHIEAHKTERKGATRQSYDEAGSGVVFEASDGSKWVLTNRHVILGASPEDVMLRASNGREFYPTKIVADPSTDVAVMKIDGFGIPSARLGDSELVEIGDFVVAIGSPFGLSHSVTFGILSAKGRRDLSLGEQKIDLQDFFQTDAAINPGNSGGPLLNLRGEVIGLNTAIASSSGGSEGIGFAIPINMAMRVAKQLTEQGRLRRGYLGVTLDPEFTPADLAESYQVLVQAGVQGGALVKNVRPGSPAFAAHLQRGDIIVEFDGKAIDNDDHLVARVGLTPIGDPTPMIIYRDGKRYRTEVTIADLK